MNTYKIEIRETLSRIIETNADSANEAQQNAIELYNDEEIILDSSDHISTDFDVAEDDKEIVKLLNDEKFSEFILSNAEKTIVNLSKEELAKIAFGSLIDAKEKFENT